jgi:HSP20 family protein
MEDIPDITLRRLHGRLNELLREFGRMQFAPLARHNVWTPAINTYWERDRITICVELAGVEKTSIRLGVVAREVRLSGRRALPEPKTGDQPVEEILNLEIDHGPFERVMTLPVEVDPCRVEAEYLNVDQVLATALDLKQRTVTAASSDRPQSPVLKHRFRPGKIPNGKLHSAKKRHAYSSEPGHRRTA